MSTYARWQLTVDNRVEGDNGGGVGHLGDVIPPGVAASRQQGVEGQSPQLRSLQLRAHLLHAARRRREDLAPALYQTLFIKNILKY